MHKHLRILIVRVGAMGDVLHAMPALAALRDALPSAFIGWAVEPRWAPLLASSDGGMPLVDRIHLVETGLWKRRPASIDTVRSIVALSEEMREQRYDLVVDLQGSIRSAVIGKVAGARRFAGPAAPRERAGAMLYSEHMLLSAPHVIEQACELLAAAIGQPLAAAPVILPVDGDAELWCNHLLQTLSHEQKNFVLIAPTAGWGAKAWGVERYAALALQLQEEGYAVLVNDVPGLPSQQAEAIRQASGATIVPSTVAEMIALSRRASLVIGGDTGIVHLAAALGRPTLALFGPTDPARTGPFFPDANVSVLRNPDSVVDHRRFAETEAGLARVRVEEVCAEALALLTNIKEV